MKLIKSKKAIGVDDLFPLLFVIIAFIFIILLFTYSHSKEVKEINEDLTQITREIESYDLLNKFLSTEVSINLNAGHTNLAAEIKTTNMADFIKLYYLEEDSENKKAHYSKIQFEMENMFNPLEYCYIENDIKLKRGYLIFITEDPTERAYGTSVAKDRKFPSQTYAQDQIKSIIVQPVALPNSRILYIVFKESGLNAVGDESCPIRK